MMATRVNVSIDANLRGFDLDVGPPSTSPNGSRRVLKSSRRTRRRISRQQIRSWAAAQTQTAVVVGGGPCGLAAAMMLANQGFDKIDVIEKRESPNFFEPGQWISATREEKTETILTLFFLSFLLLPDKAFVFSVDERGQKMLGEIDGAMDALREKGVGTKEEYAISRLYSNGKIQRKMLSGNMKDDQVEHIWIPRANFIGMLYDLVETKYEDQITVHFGSECESIEKTGSGYIQELKVVAKTSGSSSASSTSTSSEVTFNPTLLVGCDGLKSKVRETLVEWDTEEEGGGGGKKEESEFEMRKFPSLSAGLRYKVLTLPPSFPLKREGRDRSFHKEAYILIGASDKFEERLRLGLLPITDEHAPRTANFITASESHVIWGIKDGEGMLSFLERALPQLPIRDIVSEEEAERFAASHGARFPKPQFPSKFIKVLDGNRSGVALVGDALHAFPPDLGQGVNAGLEDLLVLRKALKDHGNDFAEALPSFQKARLPDVKALIRLMQVGYPLQYNQYKFLKMLWTIKFSLQMLVAKLLPKIFYRPGILDIQNSKLRYRDILARVESNAKHYQMGAYLLGAAVALWHVFRSKNYVLACVSILCPALLIKLFYVETPKEFKNLA